ncbi:hypothetical protein I3760_06G031900 [Carya illinoinensis]|nr:hypothetical protein I3760_06G031900 [Carya illinoinensis]
MKRKWGQDTRGRPSSPWRNFPSLDEIALPSPHLPIVKCTWLSCNDFFPHVSTEQLISYGELSCLFSLSVSIFAAQSIAIGVIVYHAIRTRISALPQDRSLWKLLLDDLLKNSVTNFKNADEFSLNN